MLQGPTKVTWLQHSAENRKDNHSLVRIQTYFIFKRFLYV